MMDRQSGVSPPAVPPRATVTVDFSPLSRSAGVGAGAGAAWTSREDDVVPLGPGISTQTSMPPVDLPYLPGRRLMEVQQRLGADFFLNIMAYHLVMTNIAMENPL
jgi:hypothetical protein